MTFVSHVPLSDRVRALRHSADLQGQRFGRFSRTTVERVRKKPPDEWPCCGRNCPEHAIDVSDEIILSMTMRATNCRI
jgi:hypothetical protein